MLNKDLAILFSLGASMASAQAIVHQQVNPNGVTQVHTALEHLSIITLPEKITRVAAGSDAAAGRVARQQCLHQTGEERTGHQSDGLDRTSVLGV